MNHDRRQIPPQQTLLLILIPLLATFAGLRLYLHLAGVQHVYPGGYLVHHLFTGVLIVIPASFLLAFETRHRRMALVALGTGSAMVLDEITYLVMTKASDADYTSNTSLYGGAGFVMLAVLLLLWLLRRSRRV